MQDFSTLHQKLGLEKFKSRLLLSKPEDIRELDGVAFDLEKKQDAYDLVFAFVFSLDEMERVIDSTAEQALVADGGYLYMAYPKKGNKQYKTHIDRDVILPRFGVTDENGFVGETPLKFSKMCSFSDTFTLCGLRCFLKRPAQKSAPSACVDDYIDRIPDLRQALDANPDILALYDALTYGYQKDWARYVYSAKSDLTREKRLLEMADIMAAGFKSKDLFRVGKK